MDQGFALPNMSEAQRTAFYAHYRAAEKDEVVGVLLAVFLGGFGAHHFYLRRPGTGVLYLLFSWTGVTYIIGWVEAFFMPGRVRRFNAEQAAYLAAVLSSQPIAPAAGIQDRIACPACGRISHAAGVRYCAACGSPLRPESMASA